MEKETNLTWANLRWEAKMFLLGLPILMAGLFFQNEQFERQKDARFEYVFEEGMKPIALMRDYEGVLDDVWLCETDTGEYVDCTIYAIRQDR